MAQGVTGSIEVGGERGFKLRIKYSQTYDVSTNKSSVQITGVDLYSSSYYGWTYYLDGSIKINGVTAIALDSATPNNSCTISRTKEYTTVDLRGTKAPVSVQHNSDGTRSVTISCNVYGFTAGGGGGSGWEANGQSSVKLTTIPRASSFSVGKVTIGSAATVTISRASSSFTHTVTMKLGSKSIQSSNAATSASLTPPSDWCSLIPNATYATGTVTVDTYNGGAKIGTSSKSVTIYVPDSAVPVLGRPTISIITGFNGMCLQGRSKARIQFSATPGAGASIMSYAISGGGYHGTSNDYTTGVLNTPGENVFTISATDSRGRTATATAKVTVTAYSKPTISIPVICRADKDGTEKENGEYVKLRADVGITSLGGSNKVIIKASYRVKRTSAWIGEVGITSGATNTLFAGNILKTNPYDIRIVARDTVEETTEVIRTINSSANYLITAKQGCIGLLKYPDTGKDGVQVGGDLWIDGSIKAYDDRSINHTPSELRDGIKYLGLKKASDIGLPVGAYAFIVSIYGWSDFTAGGVHQIAFSNTGGVYHRKESSENVWGAWKKIANLEDDIRRFGLGGYSTNVTSITNDLNNLATNGWYNKWSGDDVANCPCEYAGIFVSARDSGHVTQFCFDYVTQEILRRVRSSGKWEPWEYVNPRGTVGVEYRTTERHLGSVVYTKMVNCGALPFNTERIVVHGAAAKEVFRISAYRGSKGTIPMRYGNIAIDIYSDNKNIHILTRNFGSALSDTVTAQIWYIK